MKTFLSVLTAISCVLASSLASAQSYQYKFVIPTDKLPQIKAFLGTLDTIQGNLDKGKTVEPHLLVMATEQLQKFRPKWVVTISQKLSIQDPCPVLIELRGPSWPVIRRDAKTKRLYSVKDAQPEVGSKFFLTKEGGKWEARSTYYNWVENYRNMGNIDVLVDAANGLMLAARGIEAVELFPFLSSHR